ncbi:MAG TPA: hypothetical protein VMS64_23955 [Candidatus Methylomirabilis sp.]|nr:hypothetical protein [Candidatus Methylomirabilis sp.]
MSLPDDDARLTVLLRALPAPEPTPDLLAGARRRYHEALAARYRREAVVGLVAAGVSHALFLALLLVVFDPVDLIVGAAVTAVSATRWIIGVITVLSALPPDIWGVVAAGAAVALLPAVVLARLGRLRS